MSQFHEELNFLINSQQVITGSYQGYEAPQPQLAFYPPPVASLDLLPPQTPEQSVCRWGDTFKLKLLLRRQRACEGVKSVSRLLKASGPDLEAINALI